MSPTEPSPSAEAELLADPAAVGRAAVRLGVACEVLLGIEEADPELIEALQEPDGNGPPDYSGVLGLETGELLDVEAWKASPSGWFAHVRGSRGVIAQRESLDETLQTLRESVEAVRRLS
jgi:hypothetical protein